MTDPIMTAVVRVVTGSRVGRVFWFSGGVGVEKIYLGLVGQL